MQLIDVAKYLRDNCEPIRTSNKEVEFYENDYGELVVDFRNHVYRDYYGENKHSHLHFTLDLEDKVGITLRELPKQGGLRSEVEVGDKGHCFVTLYWE